jgi:hypothetical protein
MAGMRELTAEEKAKSYSTYYYRPHTGPSPELAPLLEDDKPMARGEALPIEQMNDLLMPGYLPGETATACCRMAAPTWPCITRCPG